MGHYQKKPYKKQIIDPIHTIDIKKELSDAMNHISDRDPIDDLFYEDYEDSIMFNDEVIMRSPSILNEPEIVKELRKEEMEGILPLWLLSKEEDEPSHQTHPLQSSKHTQTSHHFQKTNSYENILKTAKKTLDTTTTQNTKSIIFKEEE